MYATYPWKSRHTPLYVGRTRWSWYRLRSAHGQASTGSASPSGSQPSAPASPPASGFTSTYNKIVQQVYANLSLTPNFLFLSLSPFLCLSFLSLSLSLPFYQQSLLQESGIQERRWWLWGQGEREPSKFTYIFSSSFQSLHGDLLPLPPLKYNLHCRFVVSKMSLFLFFYMLCLK